MKNNKFKIFSYLFVTLIVFAASFTFSNLAHAGIGTGCFGDVNGDGGWDANFGDNCADCVSPDGGGNTWCTSTRSCVDGPDDCPGSFTQVPQGCSGVQPGVPACMCSAQYSSCSYTPGTCSPETAGCLGDGFSGCGNGICEDGEDRDSCSQDCDGGGSSGGGSSGGVCLDPTASNYLGALPCIAPGGVCSIQYFNPDDFTPPANSDTNLNFGFNAPFPWSIMLDEGNTDPIPFAGNSTSGTSNTGIINVRHIYHLNCNGQDDAYITVDPETADPGAYDDASFVSQSVPSSIPAGQTVSVTVNMQNTGTTTWTHAFGQYKLGSANPRDNNIWGTGGRIYLWNGEAVLPGETFPFTFNITAPSTPGNYDFQWQMVHDMPNGPLVPAWFGQLSANLVISVGPAVDAAQFISQTINGVVNPANISLVSGQTYPVSITMKNVGGTSWSQGTGQYTLGSYNAQDNTLWGTGGRVALTSAENITPLQQKTFTFNIIAPTSATISASAFNTSTCASTTLPTTCNFQWKMLHGAANGPIPPGWFDNPSTNVAVTVTEPVMSGTLVPDSSSCVIPNGSSICNINFTWTTTNPEGTSAITSPYPVSNTIIANGNSGGPTPFAVPYASSPRTFQLFNNAKSLVPTSPNGAGVAVTSDCAPGSSFNGSVCSANPVNGSCAATHNSCIAGTPQDTADTPTFYLWDCQGLNGGADASCSESKGAGPGGSGICGDGVLNAGEQCDFGLGNANAAPSCPAGCSTTCTLLNSCPSPQCGDGIAGNSAGEQCDRGAANGTCPSDCSASCQTNSCRKQPLFEEN